ncbi:MAG: hypothetical protein BGP04_02295 [Rhizobiales bacterium 62-17]|nr:MAG: hypothetical protein BGP04_02295 [Rhizobiales bacterium 62-17]
MALLFLANAALMVVWCSSMSGMGVVPMPGNWTVSMIWMPMCGQTWFDAAAAFVAMWTVMMAVMMQPSLALTLWRSRITGAIDLSLLSLGYLFVWVVLGLAVFATGAVLLQVAMRQPSLAHLVPVAAGVLVLLAGTFQFSFWKARHLTHCRQMVLQNGMAFRQGLRLGLHCGCNCAGLTVLLLVFGMMDLRIMAVGTVAATVERITRSGITAAHVIGALAIGVGVLMIARAVVGSLSL